MCGVFKPHGHAPNNEKGGKGLRTSYLYMVREHFIAMRAQHMSEGDYVSPCR